MRDGWLRVQRSVGEQLAHYQTRIVGERRKAPFGELRRDQTARLGDRLGGASNET